ncbi:DUF2489 domain-containing protein [Motilimonas pumila]|uniref:DUF2489 domain-containing protein n=1 Tax=Motilimonas pumila TaxID=2303987 RepID=UPI001E61B859|nr:DUF2489 domain-containing protein [Motilimonas pumila]
MLLWILAALGVVIIVALAVYAGRLLRQVEEQKRALAAAIKTRNDKLIESIHLIAKAMVQGQCNLSEGAIRQTVLLGELKLDQPVVVEQEYQAMSELYQVVKDMPTHSVRKEKPKKEIRALDREREKHEQRLEAAIIEEMKLLQDRQF